MNVQDVLTLAIEAIFWAFVGIMMFQFITELFVSVANTNSVISEENSDVVSQLPSSVLSEVAVTIPSETTRKFEQLPDPWTLEPKVAQTNSPVAAILPFPTLRLLPPAKEIKLQSKRTRTPKKTESVAKSKTNKKTDIVTPTSKRKPGRPRKVA
ncbi:hypothetical protein FNW02_34515 [Komarekiella sp. 'clone 1']|uniref:Uncharacterized protein n=1 Tax=Komarekiella delphini-convector SJRDD-AB1 TaxID=2593771 RepID=A0AA40T4F0_9NOST|nr:hypothetical protein [Komarekiella delphini-convector]MBD6620738.1 hypothetical protein [Komarekiella delphini-convector SJRDD-AB1]